MWRHFVSFRVVLTNQYSARRARRAARGGREEMSPETLTVDLGDRSYPILIGSDWLEQLGPALRERSSHERALVVSDNRVNGLYGDAVLASLANAGFSAEMLVVPEGEQFKTLGPFWPRSAAASWAI